MLKLLIVDDEPAICNLLENRFSEEGTCEILKADCGVKALEIVKAQRPQVVILDIMMPDMSGMDVLKKIRAFDESIKVIVITILTDISFREGANKLGAYKFFLKPFDIEILIKIVQDILNEV